MLFEVSTDHERSCDFRCFHLSVLLNISVECLTQGRGNQGGGRQWGQLAPTTLKLRGRRPQLWTVIVVHFIFVCFCTRSWVSPKKIVGQIRGAFSFGLGLPWTPGGVCLPPPQLQRSSRAPGVR